MKSSGLSNECVVFRENDRNSFAHFIFTLAIKWVAVSAAISGVLVFSGENGGAPCPTSIGPPSV